MTSLAYVGSKRALAREGGQQRGAAAGGQQRGQQGGQQEGEQVGQVGEQAGSFPSWLTICACRKNNLAVMRDHAQCCQSEAASLRRHMQAYDWAITQFESTFASMVTDLEGDDRLADQLSVLGSASAAAPCNSWRASGAPDGAPGILAWL